MKRLAYGLLGCAVALTLAWAQDAPEKVKIERSTETGKTAKYEIAMDLDVGGTKADVTFLLSRTVEKIQDDTTTIKGKIDNFKVVVDGEELEVPAAEPTSAELTPEGMLKRFTGGFDGMDMPKLHLAMALIAPSTELAKDVPWRLESKAAGTIPAFKVETTFVGTEDVKGEKALKFKIAIKESEGDYKSSGVFWTKKDGTILKFESKIEGLPIPAAGASATGMIKGTLVP